jgi:RHS repeat-associated protein
MPFGRMLTASDNGRSAAGCYPAAPDPADSRASQKFTGKERDAETGLDYFGARYYSGALGRFTSPDPLYIEARRLADPQQLNLYAYVRNNPLKLVDPTGMYIDFDCDTSDNCDEAVEMFNSRNGGQFTVGLGKNNRLEVIGDVNRKELGKAEKALFDAITDDKKGGILQVSGDTGRSDFGAFEGIGLNSVDLGNLSKLDAANGSINSGDVIAHEGLEGYFSLSTKNFGKAHNEVLKKGLLGLTKTGYEYGVSRGALSGDRTWYDISGGRGSMSVTTKLITPIPTQSLSGYPLPTRESMIENAPRRVEEVQFVP